MARPPTRLRRPRKVGQRADMKTLLTGFAGALALLLVALALTILLVTRIFRAAMLNYGKALRPREIWRALVQA